MIVKAKQSMQIVCEHTLNLKYEPVIDHIYFIIEKKYRKNKVTSVWINIMKVKPVKLFIDSIQERR